MNALTLCVEDPDAQKVRSVLFRGVLGPPQELLDQR